VFGAGNGNGNGPGLPTAQGAGNMIMVADPTTFRVLPWAERTGWVLCDLHLDDGAPVPVSTRALHRAALDRLAKAGFAYMAGLEVEFHLFKIEDPRLAPATLTWPAEPPAVSHTTRGYHYLTEAPIDQVDGILQTLRRALGTANMVTKEPLQAAYERSDWCVVPAAGVAGEAMVALVLADAFLQKFGGDSLAETRRNFDNYARQIDEF